MKPHRLSKPLTAIKKLLDEGLEDHREDTLRHNVKIAAVRIEAQIEMLDMGLHDQDLSDTRTPET